MSGIHRTKIDWADATYNPVSGCLHDCPYCYARNQARRFKPKPSEWPEKGTVLTAAHDARCFIETKPTVLRDADGKYLRSTPYPKGFAPTIHSYKLSYLQTAKTPRRIFVGSMTDLFGDWVPNEWLAAIFRECYEAPQHVYMFLTKNPARYAELARSGLLPEGDNYWYGTTVTQSGQDVYTPHTRNTFVSIEPILGPIDFLVQGDPAFRWMSKWIIAGAMTGPSAKKHPVRREWIDAIEDNCKANNIPLFLKESLATIWGAPLTQEYPAEMMAHIGKEAKA